MIDSERLNEDMRLEMGEYEKMALTVVDEDTTLAPEGMTAQKTSLKDRLLTGIIQSLQAGRDF